jgi:predicted acyl esterase
MADLTREASPAETVTHHVDVTTSAGATNRWLAIDLGRAPAYPDRKHADDSLLTFTSGPLPDDVHVPGFPVVTMYLAASGSRWPWMPGSRICRLCQHHAGETSSAPFDRRCQNHACFSASPDTRSQRPCSLARRVARYAVMAILPPG